MLEERFQPFAQVFWSGAKFIIETAVIGIVITKQTVAAHSAVPHHANSDDTNTHDNSAANHTDAQYGQGQPQEETKQVQEEQPKRFAALS